MELGVPKPQERSVAMRRFAEVERRLPKLDARRDAEVAEVGNAEAPQTRRRIVAMRRFAGVGRGLPNPRTLRAVEDCRLGRGLPSPRERSSCCGAWNRGEQVGARWERIRSRWGEVGARWGRGGVRWGGAQAAERKRQVTLVAASPTWTSVLPTLVSASIPPRPELPPARLL